MTVDQARLKHQWQSHQWQSQRRVSRRGLLRKSGWIAAVLAITALAGCAPTPEVTPSADNVPADVVVRVVDNAYEPAEVTITTGQAVRWDFEGSMEHDVIAEDGSFVSELQLTGSYTHVFGDAGEFAYDCSIHPEMQGTVTVTP